MTRVPPFFLMSIVAAVACSGERAGQTRLADGSYKLECRKPLADCLAAFNVCSQYGYDVIQGGEETLRYGVEPVNSVVITSKAIVRCRSAGALLGDNPSSGPAASATSEKAKPHCFPGATQACLGPGACHGAQTCRDDGARFGPCDCGGAQGVLPPREANDAGPPATWATPPDGGAPP